MTYEEIVAHAKKKMADVDVSDYKGHLAVQVNIIGEGSGAFYVELNDGSAAVEPYEYFDRDAILIATADVFNAMVDGKKDAVAGELRVEGNLDKAQEFGNILKKTKKKAAKKPAAKTTAKTAKAPAKKPAAKAPAKATAKAAKTEEKTAEPVKKVTETAKKAAVATAKKVVAKKAAETK